MKILGLIEKKDLVPWLELISKKYRVFVPVQDKEEARIDFIDYNDLSRLGGGRENKRYTMNFSEKTRLSPKMAFFPSTEKFFDFEYIKDIADPDNVRTDLKITRPEENGRPVLLFGVKPCDTAGLKRLDIFYGEGKNRDAYYLKKRKNSIVVSLGCGSPFHDCFCTSVEGHPFDFENADMGLVEIENGFAMVKANKKAKAFLDYSKKFISSVPPDIELEETVDALVEDAAKKIKEYWKDISKDELSDLMDRSMEQELWEEITAKCISCAACTYVCPTCFCFNIRDEQKGLNGERYRCWDYCMNSYYTLEASGHNPRANKSKRYRNKVNCKYNYNIKRSNNYFCVGCGRCIEVCPVSVDIRRVVDTLIENRNTTSVK